MKKHQIENAGKAVEALAGAGKLADAQEVIDRVRAVDDSASTRSTLLRHLKQVDRAELMER